MSGASVIALLCSGWRKEERKTGRGSQLQLKARSQVNFYVEAVKGYDDTTDCSVRWVVDRSTIRQDRDLGPGTTTKVIGK